MRAAVSLMGLAAESDVVYVSAKGRRFHEDPDCRALGAGHMIFACRCGDPYCGCAGDKPPVPQEISVQSAAFRDLVPCAVCYPRFQEIAVQLVADDHFGHRPVFIFGGDTPTCVRCFLRHKSFLEAVSWPCMSAQILNIAPRQEERIS